MSGPGYVDIAAVEALGQYVTGLLGPMQTASAVRFGDLAIDVPADQIVPVLKLLRDDQRCLFTTLIDITAVDYPSRAKRFEVVYHLLSMRKNQRIRIKLNTDEDTPVASITSLWPCADWYEREVFDMFGVAFSGHPDLRRILTDYGFQGHPLRKEFPMTGFLEVRYDPEQQRVVYEPVKLPAAFRNFDFLSPWEGMLPGDEKAKS
jgi:NADH-quinone oxidoreductase subunit C